MILYPHHHVSDTPDSYKETVAVEDAVRIVRSIAHATGTETIPIDEADGRTLAKRIITPTDLPGFDRSSYNGYVIISSDTIKASEKSPVSLKLVGDIEKGVLEEVRIKPGQCMHIHTGGVIPLDADAVIQQEDISKSEGLIQIRRTVNQGENITRGDEDFKKNEAIYPKGWIIRPQDIGVLASIGITRVTVRKKPIIGIISTGRELIPPESVPQKGQVREVNSYLISAFCRRQKAIPVRYGIIRDEPDELEQLLMHAANECDALIVSGGSARDHNDVTARVIRSLGEVYTDSISFSPEKQTTIGRIGSVLIIGLPGHPSSTFMVLALVVIHLIQALKGSPCQRVYRKRVYLADDLHAHPDNDRYIRVSIHEDKAYPVFGKAGLMNMLALSDGLVRVPAGHTGFTTGAMVDVMIW